ncbi:DUF2059 domain-containing protein [Magnetococcales bacterium HHB-1]
MLIQKRALFLILLLSLLSFQARASNNSFSLIQLLIVQSGMDEQIEQIPALMKMGMMQSTQQQPEKLQKITLEVMETAYDVDAIRRTLRVYLQKHMQTTDIKKTLAWLNTPLGQKITNMEKAASTPLAMTESMRMAPQLRKNSARLKQIHRLDQSADFTGKTLKMTKNAQLGMMIAVQSNLPPALRPSLENLNQQLDKQLQNAIPTLKKQVIDSLLYSYRDLSDQELETYIQFSESPPGKQFNRVMLDGFNQAFLDSSKLFGRLLAERILETRKSQ